MTMRRLAIVMLLIQNVFCFFHARPAQATCATSGASQSTIVVGLSNLPSSIDPIAGWHYQHFLMVQNAFQPLIRVNEQGQVISAIAKSWIPSENGQKYTFTIDPRAVFHDGKKVTSHDVAYSFARHLWVNSPSVMKQRLASILIGAKELPVGILPSGIEINSEDTVVFKLIGPYPPFLRLLAMPTFAIVSEHSFQNPAHPVGSGPMTAEYDDVAIEWRFRKFPAYQLSDISVNELVVRQTKNTGEALGAVESGSLDLLIGGNSEAIQSQPRTDHMTVTPIQALATMHLFFNNARALFHHPVLRKDIAASLNSVAKQITEKSVSLTYSPYFMPRGILPASYYDRPVLAFDGNAIRNKWRKTLHGRKIKIVLRSEYFDNASREILANVLRTFGFDPLVISTTSGSITAFLQHNDYDIIAGGYMASFPDPDAFIDSVSNVDSTYHYGNVPSADLLQDIEQIQLNGDAEARLRAYAQKLMAFEDHWYFVPMFRLSLPYVHTKLLRIPDSYYRYEPELWRMHCSPPKRPSWL